MKDKINKALELISVPAGLSEDVRAGIERAVRKRSAVTSVHKGIFAALAATIAVCIGIAVFIGFGNSGVKILTEKDVNIVFAGFDSDGSPSFAAEYLTGSKKGETTPIKLLNYVIEDENNTEVAISRNGKIYYDTLGLVYYWSDSNGDIYTTNLFQGTYKVIVYADGTTESELIEGEWPVEINFEKDLNCQVFFDPRMNYVGSVEEGTAYKAQDGEVELRISESDGGDKTVEFVLNSSEYPFDSVERIVLMSFIFFDGDRNFSGGISGSLVAESGHGSCELGSGGSLTFNGNTVTLNDIEPGSRITLKVYSLKLIRTDGTVIEIQGDWTVDLYA